MKRWLVNGSICVYLSALLWGLFSHTFSYKHLSHPVMYYLVWDMFGGWSPFESRTLVFGEGESGQFYQLSPPPWGGPKPWGAAHRATLDPSLNRNWNYAVNTLRHTRHEPIGQVFVIEECWAKQYNFPDHLWKKQFDEPKDMRKYYNLVRIFSSEGEIEVERLDWRGKLLSHSIMNNPRLMQDMQSTKRVMHIEGYRPESTRPGFDDATALPPLAD